MPRKRQNTSQPDLFDSAPSTPAAPKPSSVDSADSNPVSDAVSFITGLDDDLRRVIDVAQAELQRRQGRAVASVTAPEAGRAIVEVRRQRAKAAAEAALTPGQASAVRAALAAGLSVRRVAKQFGVSEKAVRQVVSR